MVGTVNVMLAILNASTAEQFVFIFDGQHRMPEMDTNLLCRPEPMLSWKLQPTHPTGPSKYGGSSNKSRRQMK
jgi:hypothetical protein